MPLATNMCVVSFAELKASVQQDAVGLSMHSNSHLSIRLDCDALHRCTSNLACGQRSRDDTGYMQRINATYELHSPRW
jgi:hypothetical protein